MKRFKCERISDGKVKEVKAAAHRSACNKAFKPPEGWHRVESDSGSADLSLVTATHLGAGNEQKHFTLEDHG